MFFVTSSLSGAWPEAKPLPEYIPEGVSGPEVFMTDSNQGGSVQFITPSGISASGQRPPPTPVPKPYATLHSIQPLTPGAGAQGRAAGIGGVPGTRDDRPGHAAW